MRTVVIDSNMVDYVLGLPGRYEAFLSAIEQGRLELLFTHVTLDEIAATPDEGRRGLLLVNLVSLGRIVPTGAAVMDFSRLDYCRFTDEDDFGALEAFRSGNIKHTRDALIASTARYEKCALVTFDERLTKRAREHGLEVLTPEQLLDEVTA